MYHEIKQGCACASARRRLPTKRRELREIMGNYGELWGNNSFSGGLPFTVHWRHGGKHKAQARERRGPKNLRQPQLGLQYHSSKSSTTPNVVHHNYQFPLGGWHASEGPMTKHIWANHEVFPTTPAPQAGINATRVAYNRVAYSRVPY